MENASANTVLNVERPGRYFRKPAGPRVLLREPEVCAECNKVFVSLYAIRSCADHQGLEEI
jgi:hypothetical protein